MSSDYYIFKRISKKEILSKTDIEIVTKDNREFLIDKYGNAISIIPQMVSSGKDAEPHLDNENIRQLTRYGCNNAVYIIDTLVREFTMFYYSDDGFENLYRPAEVSHDPYLHSNIIRDMKNTHGYIVVDIDQIFIPERTEDDYLK